MCCTPTRDLCWQIDIEYTVVRFTTYLHRYFNGCLIDFRPLAWQIGNSRLDLFLLTRVFFSTDGSFPQPVPPAVIFPLLSLRIIRGYLNLEASFRIIIPEYLFSFVASVLAISCEP